MGSGASKRHESDADNALDGSESGDDRESQHEIVLEDYDDVDTEGSGQNEDDDDDGRGDVLGNAHSSSRMQNSGRGGTMGLSRSHVNGIGRTIRSSWPGGGASRLRLADSTGNGSGSCGGSSDGPPCDDPYDSLGQTLLESDLTPRTKQKVAMFVVSSPVRPLMPPPPCTIRPVTVTRTAAHSVLFAGRGHTTTRSRPSRSLLAIAPTHAAGTPD